MLQLKYSKLCAHKVMSKLVFLLPLVALAELHGDELQQKPFGGDGDGTNDAASCPVARVVPPIG